MQKEIIEIVPRVIELYLLASDPLFLFVSLRDLSSIKILSDKYSTKQLVRFYSNKKTHKDINRQYLYYIILIALSFKTYVEANQYLKSLGKEKYLWAKELAELALSSLESLQFESIIIKIEKEPVIQREPLRHLIADSASDMNINFKDKENEN